MTPKEKAEELVNKYSLLVPIEFGGMNKESAKQCALIAVDEILKLPFENQSERNYWQQVKIEIEKL